jgi:hypothetical protein
MQLVGIALLSVVSIARKGRIEGLSCYMTPCINLRAGNMNVKMGTTNISEEHACTFRITIAASYPGFGEIYCPFLQGYHEDRTHIPDSMVHIPEYLSINNKGYISPAS